MILIKFEFHMTLIFIWICISWSIYSIQEFRSAPWVLVYPTPSWMGYWWGLSGFLQYGYTVLMRFERVSPVWIYYWWDLSWFLQYGYTTDEVWAGFSSMDILNFDEVWAGFSSMDILLMRFELVSPVWISSLFIHIDEV